MAPAWRLRVLAYRDSVRARHRDNPEALAAYDVVLCTYGCLVQDSPLKGTPRGLFRPVPLLHAGVLKGFQAGFRTESISTPCGLFSSASLAAQGCAQGVWGLHCATSCMVQDIAQLLIAGCDTLRGIRVPNTLHGCAGLLRFTAEHLPTEQSYTDELPGQACV